MAHGSFCLKRRVLKCFIFLIPQQYSNNVDLLKDETLAIRSHIDCDITTRPCVAPPPPRIKRYALV